MSEAICVREIQENGVTQRTMLSVPDGFIKFTGNMMVSTERDDEGRLFVEIEAFRTRYIKTPWWIFWQTSREVEVKVVDWYEDWKFNFYTETVFGCDV